MRLAKLLYRDLLLVARQFDRHASLRALVTSVMQFPVECAPKAPPPHVEAYNRCLQRFLEDKTFYLPSQTRPTMLKIIREEFRKPQVAKAVGVKFDGVDAAFLALKALNDKLAEAKELGMLPSASTDTEPTDVVYRPVPSVQLAENVASGVFLLSHPLLSGAFGRAVVILTEHSLQGSRGFIVNKPTSRLFKDAFRVPPHMMKAFGSSKVHAGGPVHTPSAEILHGRAEFGGQRVVASNFPSGDEPSLFVGMDLASAAQAVDDKTAQQSDVAFLNGVSSWTAGQLDKELARGSWVAVKAPVSLAINAPKELWRDLMGTLGGEYEEFSRMPPIDKD